MKLHRPNGSSDWAKLPARKRNQWQVLAVKTHGYVTPGNAVTILGFALVIIGIVLVVHTNYVWGFTILALGRLCDLVDGWLADVTKTKSYLGAFIDVTADKLEGLVVLLSLPIAGIMPWWAAGAIIALQAYISLISVLVMRRRVPIFPTRSGKWGMTATWVSILSFVIAVRFDGVPGALLRLCGVGVAVIALALSGYAASRYTQQYTGLQAKAK